MIQEIINYVFRKLKYICACLCRCGIHYRTLVCPEDMGATDHDSPGRILVSFEALELIIFFIKIISIYRII